jgi:Glycosyl hydrolase family 71
MTSSFMVGNTFVLPLSSLSSYDYADSCSPIPVMTGRATFNWHGHVACEFVYNSPMLWSKIFIRVNSDAFALNVGREDWQKARVIDCYATAHQLQTDFKLFLSFDMT